MQRWGFSLIDQKLLKWRGFELRRIWDILGYLYNTLSAVFWYEAFVLGFWNFTQANIIYCRCATSKFQFDRPKIVEITGSELRRIWDILGYLHNTLSALLWYEACVLGFWNFTQWKNIFCRCATSRFQLDRLTMSKFPWSKLRGNRENKCISQHCPQHYCITCMVYEAFVLEIWNSTQWTNINCEDALHWSFSLMYHRRWNYCVINYALYYA